MKWNEHIDDLIAREKLEKPNPFLQTRVMEALSDRRPVASLWPRLALALIVSIAVVFGVGIGRTFAPDASASQPLVINDYTMESLPFYTSLGDE